MYFRNLSMFALIPWNYFRIFSDPSNLSFVGSLLNSKPRKALTTYFRCIFLNHQQIRSIHTHKALPFSFVTGALMKKIKFTSQPNNICNLHHSLKTIMLIEIRIAHSRRSTTYIACVSLAYEVAFRWGTRDLPIGLSEFRDGGIWARIFKQQRPLVKKSLGSYGEARHTVDFRAEISAPSRSETFEQNLTSKPQQLHRLKLLPEGCRVYHNKSQALLMSTIFSTGM